MVFGYTRVMVAAFGLGAGWSALDRAIPYSTKRIQGGTPLSEKQGYTHKLIVPHVVKLEAGRAFIEETAQRIDAASEGSLNTEGAIAKYMSTEAGDAAADASIQALGGYGYTHEYMVEKISRDVRITRIYEGTSEIMEMTISRDRWQLHLKTRGQHYHDRAREAEVAARGASQRRRRRRRAGSARAGRADGEGARTSAHSLPAHPVPHRRVDRLCRVRVHPGARAALAAEGRMHEKANDRFDATALAAISRIFAREAAMKVAQEGLKIIAGAGGVSDEEMPLFEAALSMNAIHRAQKGLVDDMDYVADVLYNRVKKEKELKQPVLA